MKNKVFRFLSLTMVICLSIAFTAFAAGEDFSATSIVTTAVADIATTLMQVLGIVVSGIIGFMAAKIGIIKAIGFIKTMTGKA